VHKVFLYDLTLTLVTDRRTDGRQLVLMNDSTVT